MERWLNEFESILEKNRADRALIFKTPSQLNFEFKRTPYSFDPAKPVRTYAQVRADGNAACAEAAAAIGAAILNHGGKFDLCLKKDSTNATHAVIIQDGVTFDPYGQYFTRGINACFKKPQFFPVR
mgnify:CR=1 FL=1|jgi:hypothetical protein